MPRVELGATMSTDAERLTEKLDSIWNHMERARQAYETAMDEAGNLPVEYRAQITFSLGLTELAVGGDQRLVDLIRREVANVPE